MERLKQYLPILKNPNTQQKGNFSIEVLNPEKGDYLLIDSTNKDWFPIHEDIPELLTTQLLYPQTLEHFKQYYVNHIEDLGLEFPVLATNQQQLEQRAHFDNFSEDDKFSYDDFENLPFWIAVDAFVHEYYNLSAQEECFVLDIGCGKLFF